MEPDLGFIPVTQTTWDLWRTLHPDTLALDKEGRCQGGSYSSYYHSGAAGALGEPRKDGRLDSKELALGVDAASRTKAYPLSALEGNSVVNDTLAGRPVLVFFDTAFVYDGAVGVQMLTFHVEGSASGPQIILVDNETGSRWMAFAGRAI